MDRAVMTDAAVQIKIHTVAVMRIGRIVGGHSAVAFRRNRLAAAQRVDPGGDIRRVGNQVARALGESRSRFDLLIGVALRPGRRAG